METYLTHIPYPYNNYIFMKWKWDANEFTHTSTKHWKVETAQVLIMGVSIQKHSSRLKRNKK